MLNKHSLTTLAIAMVGLVSVAGPACASDASLSMTAEGVPPAPALSAAGEGRRQYMRLNCYSCHGMHAGGGMGPNIVHAESGDLKEVMLGGGEHGMPSFRNYVTTTDITNLAAYLKSIGTSGEPVFVDWWKKNPKK